MKPNKQNKKRAAPAAVAVDTLNANETMNVTIRVRRKKSIEPALKRGKRISHAEYENNYGAAESDLALVSAFAQEHHLTEIEVSPARRSIVLTGSVKDFEEAFKVHLSNYRAADGTVFRGRTGGIQVPQELEGVVEGVFGLDNRPHATPKFQILQQEGMFANHNIVGSSFTADKITKLYGFPSGMTGAGQCIGIVELGGGFRNADLQSYFSGLGLAKPSVTAKSVDGGLVAPHPTQTRRRPLLLQSG